MAEVGTCPRCGKSIDETHGYYGCPKCGQGLPEEIRNRLPNLVALAALVAASAGDSSVSSTQSGSPVVNRYRDAYRVGAALVGLGDAVKIVGTILAVIILLVSLNSGAGQVLVAGICLGAIAGGLFWVCGVIVAALGQLLRATLDQAVASSPFLTDAERADAMGLPYTVTDRSAG